MKYVQWNGSRLVNRTIHGYEFSHGEIHKVEDDLEAEDMLTQPNDHFVEVTRSQYQKQQRSLQK